MLIGHVKLSKANSFELLYSEVLKHCNCLLSCLQDAVFIFIKNETYYIQYFSVLVVYQHSLKKYIF